MKQTDFTQVQPTNTNDQMGFALFLAVAVHALLIFGLGFSIMQREAPPPTLEVTLAQHSSKKAPEQADFLAQANQLGSGDEAEKSEITTDRSADLPAPITREATPLAPKPAQQRAPEQTALVSTTHALAKPAANARTAEHAPGEQAENIAANPLRELASLQARLDQQRQEYSRMPRVRRLTSASTRSAEEANYMRYWVERIEQIGNENYPQEARRQQLYGDLRLAVTLNPDGSVAQVEVLLSSGLRVLDHAAIRIVRLAGPFAPFPAELKDWDKFEIIRTWRFVTGDRLKTEQLK